jgi:hypothetical protein
MTGVTETQWQRRLLEHLRFLAEEALAPDLFDRLVARLYEDWPCAIAILSYEPDQQFSNQGATWGFDEALLHQFRLHYYTVNPYPEVVVAHGLLNATANIETYFPRPRLWKTEYYNDFMRPQCLEHVMALSIDLGRSVTMSVVIGQYVQRRLHASVRRRSIPQGIGA